MAREFADGRCRACRADALDMRDFTFGGEGESYPERRTYEYGRCGDCGTITFWEDGEVDYASHTDNPLALRDYLEAGASVDGLAAMTLGLLDGLSPGRLVDVGCGFGFGCDAARTLAGWDVIGFEPSAYGEVGHELLGFPLERAYFDSAALQAGSVDAVIASEVIEHIDDPLAFAVDIRRALRDGGRFVLTTPNAALLVDEPWDLASGRVLGALSPGFHRVVFSRDGIERLLRAAGFESFTVFEDEGTLRCVTGVEDQPFPTVQQQLGWGLDYARAVLERVNGDSEDWRVTSLRDGLRFRALRYAVDLGRMGDAADLLRDVGEARRGDGSTVRTFTDFMRQYRSFEPSLAYCAARIRLDADDPAGARDRYLRAQALCEDKLRVAASIAVIEEQLVWRCRIERALVDRTLGRFEESAREADALLAAAGGGGVPEDVIASARRLRADLDLSPPPSVAPQARRVGLVERLRGAIGPKRTVD